MRRISAAAAILALAGALAGCSSVENPAPSMSAGSPTLDATGTVAVRVPLEWPPYERSSGDGPITYEVRVWKALDRLPREEAARLDGIYTSSTTLAVRLPRGDYVWSVRARFVREGWPCVSGWYAIGHTSDDRLLPRRRFAPFSVP